MSQAEQRLTAADADHPGDGVREDISLADAGRQILASCLSFTLVIQVGSSLSFSAVLLPQLAAEHSPIKLTTDQASWIASLFTLMIPVGSLLAGPLMDRFGRRTLSALGGLPFVAGWLTIALAADVAHLIVARVLTGLAAGFSTVCLVYCSEITHPTYRPMLLGLNSVFVSLGILVTCSLGVNVPWRTQAIVYCCLSLLTVVLHWPLPESPHWLRSPLEAERALRWLYTQPDIQQNQLAILVRERERKAVHKPQSGFRACLQPIVYRPLVLLVGIFMFQQLSGAYVVIFYAVDIFEQVKVQYVDFALIMFGAIRLVMALVSLFLSRVFGRRPLLFCSGLGMCASCLAAFCLRHFSEGSPGVGVCVLVYVCFGALGVLGIPWTLIGELFPVKVKGLVSGWMITVAYVFMFAVVKLYPVLTRHLDIKYLFLTFSINSLLEVLVVYRWFPETFGVNFSEIEKQFLR